MEAVYVHDAAAYAAVVDPGLFDWEKGAVVVVADGPAKGRTIRDEGERGGAELRAVCCGVLCWPVKWPWAVVQRGELSWCHHGAHGSAARPPAPFAPLPLPRPAIPPACLALHAGKKNWVGTNEWQGLPAIQVAVGVRSQQLVDWVLDRMMR